MDVNARLCKFIGVGLAVALVAGMVPRTDSAPATTPGVRLVLSEPTGLVVECIAPPFEVLPDVGDEVRVKAAGYPQLNEPGAPKVPFMSSVIALPAAVQPELRIIALEEETQRLPASVAVAPRPDGVARDSEGRPIGETFESVPPNERSTLTAPVVLEEMGIMRGVRLARLNFYPIRPDGLTLRITQRAQVEIRWPAQPQRMRAGRSSDPLVSLLGTQVLNPDGVFDGAPASPAKSRGTAAGSSGAPSAFLTVPSAGLYEVSYGDLAAYGGFARANPQNLRLFRGSEEVACDWLGDGDDVFEPGESLRFYGEPRSSRWTPDDVYRLVADSAPGLRATGRSASPSGLPGGSLWVEQVSAEHHIYTPDCFCGVLPKCHDGDRWAWVELKRGYDDPYPSASFSFQLAAVDSSRSATLTVWLIGQTAVSANPDHRVSVKVNNISLGNVDWDGKTAKTSTLSLASGVLRTGANTLVLSLPGISGVSMEAAWVDGFSARYARSAAAAVSSLRFDGSTLRSAYAVTLSDDTPASAYDVTDPLHVQKLTGFAQSGALVTLGDPDAGLPRRYMVAHASGVPHSAIRPMILAAEPNGADMLIITAPEFRGALDPLVNLRQAQGLLVAVVDAPAIYDTYGDGRPDPVAIRNFIASAYASWSPHPAYILLVGNGTFDPKRYKPASETTYIPPFLADADRNGGETAADNRYVCVDGADTLPDIAIGRLPVDSLAEAQAVVAKVVTYETAPAPGNWNEKVELVADDTEDGQNFGASSDDHAAQNLNAPFTQVRRYCPGNDPWSSDCPVSQARTIHDGLIADWNAGRLVVQYTGHASWQQWAQESFLSLGDVSLLQSSARWPVVVEMTCFTSAFHRPRSADPYLQATLDADLVRRAGGGALATWGSTGMGMTGGHDDLDDGFFEATFGDRVDRLGEATLAAKAVLAARSTYLDLLDTFTLLGDPATRFNAEQSAPQADLSVHVGSAPVPAAPGAPIAYTISVTNAGPSYVRTITLTDQLPAGLESWQYTPSAGVFDSLTGAWSGLYLNPGDRAALTVLGRVQPSFRGTMTHTVAVTSAYAADPAPQNNWDVDINPAEPRADLSIRIATDPSPLVPGQDVTCTLTVANAGSSLVSAITVTADPPPLQNLSFEASQGNYDGATGAWSGLYLSTGSTVFLTVRGTWVPSFAGTPVITATVTTNLAFDPNLGNNVATNQSRSSENRGIYLPMIVRSR